MTLEELKIAYNQIIKREKAAEIFLKSDRFFNATEDKKRIWLKAFDDITVQLSLLMRNYRELTGVNMTDIEVIGGFGI